MEPSTAGRRALGREGAGSSRGLGCGAHGSHSPLFTLEELTLSWQLSVHGPSPALHWKEEKLSVGYALVCVW